jgi:hypothetical protein
VLHSPHHDAREETLTATTKREPVFVVVEIDDSRVMT